MNKLFTFLILAVLIANSAIAGNRSKINLNSFLNTELIDNKHFSNVSPNPAKTFTNIRFYNPENLEHKIDIYDLVGNKVMEVNEIFDANAEINVSNLNSGVYYYFIIKENLKISTGRLIVRR